jgi:PTH1 family peptidyl-tRNA hydrolase
MSNIFDLFKKIESTAAKKPQITYIVAGLGNPGAKYENTRHNAGFMAIDYIAERLSAKIDRAKFHSLVAEVAFGGVGVLLMKPETFMNNSGVAIAEAANFYKIPAEHVLVLHDEISFDVGVMRIRRKGSAGGHNGLKSIIEHMGSDAFPRIKIGVGKKPSPDYDLVDFVLGKFSKADIESLVTQHPSVYSAAELIVSDKIDEAMNKYSK